MKVNSIITCAGIAMTGIALVAGCNLVPTAQAPAVQGNTVADGNQLKSTLARLGPASSAADISAVTDGNNAFGWALFTTLHTDNTNLFFSPYSISTALAMAWQGAQGDTKTEMTGALHFTLDSIQFNSAMNSIDLALATRGQGAAGNEGAGFTIKCANDLWGEKTETFLQGFLDPLAQYYGAGMRICDFIHNSEATRLEINDTIEGQTNGKIKDLIPPGGVDDSTKLVITNSVYFDAAWADTFNHAATDTMRFIRSANDSMKALFMHQTNEFNYAEDQNYQALELPYGGNQVSMVFVLPKDKNAPQSGVTPSAGEIKSLVTGLSRQEVRVSIPKFTFTFGTKNIVDQLQSLGMQKAFVSGQADFSGINGQHDLSIGAVFHQAFVAVDEKGTTAAAATAVVLRGGMVIMPDPNMVAFTADHPFIFFIRDIPTGQILFMGYLSTPTSAAQ